jgi:hypothetical protein
MSSEAHIEKESCRLIQKCLANPDATPKHGKDGWPDRQVLLGFGFHCWMEFKQLTGSLRAAQVERIKRLRAQGDTVFEVRSIEQAWDSFVEFYRTCFHRDPWDPRG